MIINCYYYAPHNHTLLDEHLGSDLARIADLGTDTVSVCVQESQLTNWHQQRLRNVVDQIHARETQLVRRLINGLMQFNSVQLYGPSAQQVRGSAVSFTLKGIDPAAAGHLLDQLGIAVRTGLHCSPDSHRSCGTFPEGTIRVSPGFFTTEAQIDYFIKQIGSLRPTL